MEPQEPEDEQCTCPAFASIGEHTPTCMLYTPISSMDIPEWQRRHYSSSSISSRPLSYSAHGIGVTGGGFGGYYPPPSNVSSVAASYASTSSMLDSMAATETESLSSYLLKRTTSVSSFSSAASSTHLLPTELFREIFTYLSVEDLQSVVQVSRQWRSAGRPLLWREMVFPLDKRRLASMKQILSHIGHYVRRVIITPPMLESHQSGSSRRVSTSNSRQWSLSRPLSRAGSVSSQQPHLRPNSRNHSEAPADRAGTLSSSAVFDANLATNAPSDNVHSEHSSTLPSPLNRPGPGQIPPPSPLSLSPPQQLAASNVTTPLAELSTSATPISSVGAGRRQSRTNATASPSPMLPPVYAVPIPGTPGPGNVLSEPLSMSTSVGSWGATGLGSINIPSFSGASISSRPSNILGHHEVSEGTVLRMHQFMERYCPNVLEATVKNPTGISSHCRRLGILVRLFRAYPRLEKLDLSDFIMWDTQPLQIASEHLHMLCGLDVTNRVELSDMDLLPIIENCPRLRELQIRATNASDTTIHAIVANLSNTLVCLNVGGCSVSSAAMSELVTSCRHLRILQMWSCLRLDDSFLQALDPSILTNFQVLDMLDVQKFSAEAVRRAFGEQKWPYMRYLRIRAKCIREDFAGIPEMAVLKLNSNTILD
ncbi:hypothetical protein H4S08_001255 [Coemansia sp. RSA 1365]|nr:hypothetical protein H4S08_001255 [Coemansia sp. RSA 1365]